MDVTRRMVSKAVGLDADDRVAPAADLRDDEPMRGTRMPRQPDPPAGGSGCSAATHSPGGVPARDDASGRRWLLDDRATGTAASTLGPTWHFFTDAVMGGVSSGGMTVETVAGRPALCLRGQVRLDNNGGFVQMALDLPALPPGDAWRGIEIDVRGNGQRYGLHLRTRMMTAPWQAWRASFEATPEWRNVRLPLEAFEPCRTGGVLDAATICRVGVVAIGARFDADVCVARLAFVG
jgi:Complex I intermediate-associated protein 30 (CIA30)